MRQVLALLAAWRGIAPTSAELAGGDVRLRYQAARRLADLRERGLVAQEPARACTRTGRHALTWSVTAAGAALLKGIPDE